MRPALKPLSSQTLVITGASSGIGLATARAAAARGRQAAVGLAQRAGAARALRGIAGAGRRSGLRGRRRGRSPGAGDCRSPGRRAVRWLRHLGEQCRRLRLRDHRRHPARGPAPPVRDQLLGGGAWLEGGGGALEGAPGRRRAGHRRLGAVGPGRAGPGGLFRLQACGEGLHQRAAHGVEEGRARGQRDPDQAGRHRHTLSRPTPATTPARP